MKLFILLVVVAGIAWVVGAGCATTSINASLKTLERSGDIQVTPKGKKAFGL